jgi:hypothetical protein
MDTTDAILGANVERVECIEGFITSISLDSRIVADFANDPIGNGELDDPDVPGGKIKTDCLLYERLPTITVDSATGSGAVLGAVGDGVGGVDKIDILDFGALYHDLPTIDFSNIGNGDCIGTAEVGVVADYSGFWKTTDGRISSNKVLQDNLYYQVFSYVIRSDQLVNNYATILKKLAHPAGLTFFGQFLKNVCIDSPIIEIDSDPYSCHHPIIQDYRNYEVRSTEAPYPIDPGDGLPRPKTHPNRSGKFIGSEDYRNIPAGMAFKDIKLRDLMPLCTSAGGCE